MTQLTFPMESEAYRRARQELLQAELELRRQVETVAELRRGLPLGGVVKKEYVFDEASPSGDGIVQVSLLDLFEPEKEALVLYNFMFGPDKPACPMCTSFIDGLNGNARQLRQRLGLAVVAKSPLERLRAFGLGRGWRSLRLVSSANNDYNRDYHGEDEDGNQNPMLTVFVRREGEVHHFWSSELQAAPADQGQNQRHLDMMWPLWNVLDLVPEGRGSTWYPSLS